MIDIEDITTGKVAGLPYRVFGPFGTGYNIRVRGKGVVAEIHYHYQDGDSTRATTPAGDYEMSGDWVRDAGGKIVLKLKGQRVITKSTDQLMVALFVVNHHFWFKSGPFKKAK